MAIVCAAILHVWANPITGDFLFAVNLNFISVG